MAEIERKTYILSGKIYVFQEKFSHRAIQIAQSQGPISSCHSRKDTTIFLPHFGYFWQETGQDQRSQGHNQNLKKLVLPKQFLGIFQSKKKKKVLALSKVIFVTF